MSTLSDSGYPTVLNLAKRLGPDGKIETNIAEVLHAENPFLDDIPFEEANMATGHRITTRSNLGTAPTWRRVNQGITPTKSETEQFDETVGMLEDMSKVDVKLAEMSGNVAAFRKTEDDAKLESFAQEAGRAIFYENAMTNPNKIHGLSPRYAATSGYTASSYVLKPGTNAGSNAQSVWLITWKLGRIFGIYPRFSKMGLERKDLGEILTRDANNSEFRAFATWFRWEMGIAVRDYRYAVRMQWDPDDATNFADSAKGMYLAMQDMMGTIKSVDEGTTRFYMSRTSLRKLRAQAASNDANWMSQVNVGGKLLNTFLGIPIRVTDTLVSESAIS